MVEISIVYQGELRCASEHRPSGTIIVTDAPKDNHGKGESFSPTDLVATALGTCMLTLMGITARNLQLDLSGTKVKVKKEMTTAPVRRISKLTVVIEVLARINDQQKENLIHAALTCPVSKSLHPEIEIPVEFQWGE